jgi:NAD+--asparagine ADP-ribosyltransferase
MICKDCRCLTHHEHNVAEIIELCEKHATAEAAMTAAGLVISEYEAEAKERRRYALLQAACTLAAIMVAPGQIADAGFFVGTAEEFLGEIEKRAAREGE